MLSFESIPIKSSLDAKRISWIQAISAIHFMRRVNLLAAPLKKLIGRLISPCFSRTIIQSIYHPLRLLTQVLQQRKEIEADKQPLIFWLFAPIANDRKSPQATVK